MSAHNIEEIERTTDVEIDRSIEFQKMFLKNKVVEGLTKNNFIYPSPIQARAIPLGKCGLDLLIQAKSGTGKTLVFSILALELFNPKIAFPQTLILVPTRELALQVVEVLNKIGNQLPEFIARAFIGGLDVSGDRKNLQACSAVVGTPGRILHLISSKLLNTDEICLLVLDEADSLLKDSFKKDVREIVKTLNTKRQTIVSSATYYNNVDEQLVGFLNERYIGVTPKKEPPVLRGIKQFATVLPEQSDSMEEMKSKIEEMKRIFKMVRFKQCLIFSNYQTRAESYCNHMKTAGWTIEVITGSQTQSTRIKTMDSLKNYKCRLLIATDILARGIDVESIDLIINLDVPWDLTSYLHRIGRAGRFGSQGISITMVSVPKDMEKFKKILHKVGGDDMFVYNLPTGNIEGDVWKFHEYDKYEKIYAIDCKKEGITQEICEERRLLEPPQENVTVNPSESGIDHVNPPIANGFHISIKVKEVLETSDIRDTNDSQIQISTPDQCDNIKSHLNEPKEAIINGCNSITAQPNVIQNIEEPDCKSDLDKLIYKVMAELNFSDDDEELTDGNAEENVDDSVEYKMVPKNEMEESKTPTNEERTEIKLEDVSLVIQDETDKLIYSTMAKLHFSDDDEEEEENLKSQITNESSSIREPQTENETVKEISLNLELASTHSSQATDAFSDELILKTIKQLDLIEDDDGVNMRFSVSSTNDDLFMKIMEQKEMAVEKMKVIQPSLDGCSMDVHDDDTSEISKLNNMSIDENFDAKKPRNFVDKKNDESSSSAKKIRFADEFELRSNTTGTNMGSDDYMENEEDSSEKDLSEVSNYSNEDTESSSDSFFDDEDDEDADDENVEDDDEPEVKIEFEGDVNIETLAYHSNYANWSNQYWNQLTQIHDYVKFSRFARRNAYQNLGY